MTTSSDREIVDATDATRSVTDPILSDLFSKIGRNIKNLAYNIGRRAEAMETGWRSLSTLNSWVRYSNNYAAPEYCKDPFGFVHVRGVVASGTLTSGTVIATLPAGYRPESIMVFPAVNAGIALARVDVLPNGDIILGAAAGSATYLSICLPPFRAYQ